jgi:hypothetical protein
LDDIESRPDGIVLRIRRSKTDRNATGAKVAVALRLRSSVGRGAELALIDAPVAMLDRSPLRRCTDRYLMKSSACSLLESLLCRRRLLHTPTVSWVSWAMGPRFSHAPWSLHASG